MKKIFVFAAISLASAAVLADSYIRIPVPSMVGGKNHPAMPGGPVIPKGPVLSLDSSPIDFGTLTLDANGPVHSSATLVLSNTGDAPASLSLATSGAPFSLASADNACGSALGAGASCAVGLLFQPTVAGAGQEGTLSVNSNGGSATVSLLGAANPIPAPRLEFSGVTGVLKFAELVTGAMSPTTRVTVVNRGTGPANITLGTTGPYLIGTPAEGNTCGRAPLAAQAQCFAMVKFAPVAGGKLQAGGLSVTAEDGTLTAALEGDARWAKFPKASMSDYTNTGATFNGTPTTATLYLSNSGNADMTVTGAPYLQGHTGEYTILPSSSCVTGKVIAAFGACTVNVQFEVQADATSHAPVTLFVPNNGTDQYNVPGIQSAKVIFSGPSFMSSGYLQYTGNISDRADRPQALGPYGQGATPYYDTGNGLKYTYENITLMNRGNGPLTITGITQHGVPAIVTGTCGTLARWGTCTLKIAFHGLPVGVNIVQLRVASDGGNPTVDLYQQVTIIP